MLTQIKPVDCSHPAVTAVALLAARVGQFATRVVGSLHTSEVFDHDRRSEKGRSEQGAVHEVWRRKSQPQQQPPRTGAALATTRSAPASTATGV